MTEKVQQEKKGYSKQHPSRCESTAGLEGPHNTPGLSYPCLKTLCDKYPKDKQGQSPANCPEGAERALGLHVLTAAPLRTGTWSEGPQKSETLQTENTAALKTRETLPGFHHKFQMDA